MPVLARIARPILRHMEAPLRAKLTHIFLGCLLLITAASAQSPYSNSDLDTLVGPIALYPDPLLTNVIKASTFPDQVIAARWVTATQADVANALAAAQEGRT